MGNAISRGNAELESVLERKIRYCSLPEAVRDHFLWGSRSIVLAGTHGKTTTTSLTAWLLTSGQLDPSLLVGGIALNFGEQGSSYRVGHGRDFVIEGDEYDSAFFDKTAKFLKYLPDVAVIGNIEFDHADIYADLDAVLLAFRRLVNLVPKNGLLLLGADSPHAHALGRLAVSPVETFGLGGDATWRAEEIEHRDGLTQFTVVRRRANCSADSSRRCSVNTTCAMRWPRLASERISACQRRRWRRDCERSKASSAGSKPLASPTV